MSDPIAVGVAVMLILVGCAANIRELTELAHVVAPLVRLWLDGRSERPEKRRIGF